MEHGGSLTAASEGKDRGTSFTMTIPLYEIPSHLLPPSDEQAVLTMHQLNKTDSQRMKSLHILIVDDSAMNRKMLERWLRNKGHVCVQAIHGKDAVDLMRDNMMATDQRNFDAILMDYQMPYMDGGTAVRAIRDMGCKAFIVGITGTLFSEDVDEFMECGADTVLPKPLELPALMTALMEHCPSGEMTMDHSHGPTSMGETKSLSDCSQ